MQRLRPSKCSQASPERHHPGVRPLRLARAEDCSVCTPHRLPFASQSTGERIPLPDQTMPQAVSRIPPTEAPDAALLSPSIIGSCYPRSPPYRQYVAHASLTSPCLDQKWIPITSVHECAKFTDIMDHLVYAGTHANIRAPASAGQADPGRQIHAFGQAGSWRDGRGLRRANVGRGRL